MRDLSAPAVLAAGALALVAGHALDGARRGSGKKLAASLLLLTGGVAAAGALGVMIDRELIRKGHAS